jgi:hypothetical protein
VTTHGLLIPAGIQDEILLKNRLRSRWQITRNPALKAEVNRLPRSVTNWLNEWRNDQWGATFESLNNERLIVVEDDQASDETPYSYARWSHRRESPSPTLRRGTI